MTDDNVGLLTRVMRAVGRAIVAVIRPWPFQPVVAIPVTILFAIWVGGVALALSSANAQQLTALQVATTVLVPAAIVWGVYSLAARRFGPHRALPWPAYYTLIVATAALTVLARGVTMGEELNGLRSTSVLGLIDVVSPWVSFVRTAVVLLVLNAAFGVYGRRLRGEVLRAEAALELARDQQGLLVRADESTRRQVSAALHDRIQSSLVLIGLQVQRVGKAAPPEIAEQLRSIGDELEYVRGQRLREVIRGLAPDFSLVGLERALRELAAQYAPALEVRLDLQREAIDWAEQDLELTEAVYRISEQSLLNTVTHASARTVVIALTSSAAAVRLSIIDDGVGLPGAIEPGLGTAVTDAWTEQTGGHWQRRSRGSSGVEVSVHWAARL